MMVLSYIHTTFASIYTTHYIPIYTPSKAPSSTPTSTNPHTSTPLIISLADYWFLGRELPSLRSWVCLGLLVGGAVSYVLNDKFFKVEAYTWVAVWFMIFSFDQIYIKHKVDSVKMTTWGRVYYTNIIAMVPLAVILFVTGEIQTIQEFQWESLSVFFLSLSCVFGVAIAYFAFLARAVLSATYFTVIGTTCKIITVIVNVAIWEYHATPAGLASLFVCLVGAYFYQQAPLRNSRDLPK